VYTLVPGLVIQALDEFDVEDYKCVASHFLTATVSGGGGTFACIPRLVGEGAHSDISCKGMVGDWVWCRQCRWDATATIITLQRTTLPMQTSCNTD
jgi:hypothetical protein